MNTMLTNYKQLLLAFFALALLFTSCSNDDDVQVLAPEISMSKLEKELQITVGDTLKFAAVNLNNSEYTEHWTLGDSIVATVDTYVFEPTNSGTYTLSYEASNITGTFNYDYTIEVAAKIRPITDESNAYITELLEYLPAPGQFINKGVGNLESAEGLIGKRGLVTLGAWGGSVSYAFDHTVINREDEDDLIIYGNAMPTFAEPGVVYVMQDDNGNGLPDDTWYEINGSAHAQEGTLRTYKVTYFRPETAEDDVAWEDNRGNTGFVLKNAFHKQAYYPEWITEDSYTLTGTLLSNSRIDMSNPSVITSAPFDYGYADNTPGGDKINIADAIDTEGNPVHLSGIDFIKIQTGIQANMGWLGELSTEVAGIADLSLLE
ncbi:hypothetical protein [Gelidibacter pelagius]|uniref:Cell surface protein n=1 Tax=Gelidibacter pelagius TaxID=2819985 RepID=A0ABS3SUB9_9FLAO|nr:hypothetical protein [Gelidibacter pelagius]MBO3099309.1 hypothetical protein [Gelidibacter pelagius]